MGVYHKEEQLIFELIFFLGSTKASSFFLGSANRLFLLLFLLHLLFLKFLL
jgi:hypothetical protein